MQAIPKNLLSSSQVFHKGEEKFYYEGEKIQTYAFFAEPSQSFAEGIEEARKALASEVELKGRVLTFSLDNLEALLIENTCLIKRGNTLSLSSQMPSKKPFSLYTDHFTLTHVLQPIRVFKKTYEYSRFVEWFQNSSMKTLHGNDFSNTSIEAYSINEALQTQVERRLLEDKESPYPSPSIVQLIEKRSEIKYEKMQGTINELTRKQEKTDKLLTLSKLKKPNTKLGYLEAGLCFAKATDLGTEFVMHHSAETVVLTAAEEIPFFVGACISLGIGVFRVAQAVYTGDTAYHLSKAGCNFASAAASVVGFSPTVARYGLSFTSYVLIEGVPTLIEGMLSVSDLVKQSFKVTSVEEAYVAMFINKDDLINLDEATKKRLIDSKYRELINLANTDDNYKQALKDNHVNVKEYSSALFQAAKMIYKDNNIKWLGINKMAAVVIAQGLSVTPKDPELEPLFIDKKND